MGCCWDYSLAVANLPTGLIDLHLGDAFNQTLDDVRFPPGLQSLHLGDSFRHPLDQVRFPPGLTVLRLGDSFNEPLDEVKWPPALKVLFFGRSIDIEKVFKADCLASLHVLVVGGQVLINGGHRVLPDGSVVSSEVPQ